MSSRITKSMLTRLEAGISAGQPEKGAPKSRKGKKEDKSSRGKKSKGVKPIVVKKNLLDIAQEAQNRADQTKRNISIMRRKGPKATRDLILNILNVEPRTKKVSKKKSKETSASDPGKIDFDDSMFDFL